VLLYASQGKDMSCRLVFILILIEELENRQIGESIY